MLPAVEPTRIEPGPGQESVWDYPRPPALQPAGAHLRVEVSGVALAETDRGLRVLETSQPPAYYFPPGDVRMDLLEPSLARTFCEWKGQARYWTAVVGGRRVEDIAWSYDTPTDAFAALAGHLAFYPQKAHACFVDGEQVEPNAGSFYGGWITSRVVGPFKGGAGTGWW